MVMVAKFNFRPQHERDGIKRPKYDRRGVQRYALEDLPVNTHAVDPDFDGLGGLAEAETAVAPGLVAGYESSFTDVSLRPATPRLD